MKKIIFLLFFTLFVFASCKKSSSSPLTVGSVTATIDGKSETFNVSATALNGSSFGSYSIIIGGYNGSVASGDWVSLSINSTKPITVGSYTSSINNSLGSPLSMTYFQQSNIYYDFDATNKTNVVNLTISSLTSTNIQGTFSGIISLVSPGVPSTTTKSVTNGRFNLNF